MNVACTHCESIFRVDPAKVPVAGVRARCSICSGIFWVIREDAGAAPSAPGPIPARSAEPVSAPPPPPPPRVEAPPSAGFAASPPAPAAAPRAPEPAIPRPVASPSVPVAPPSVPVAQPPPAAPVATPAAPAAPQRAAPPGPAFGGAAPTPPRPASPGEGRPPGPAFSAPGAPYSRPAATPPPAAPAAPMPPVRPVSPPPAAGVTPPMTRPKRPANPFLSQDPDARARRLARALVSDIVVYHPAKRRDALRDGSLKLMFEEEIRKSWEEYVDQVGKELADSTSYFNDALNEILADGQPVFP